MNASVVFNQLMALRHQCLALAGQVDLLMTEMQAVLNPQAATAPETPVAPSAPVESEDNGPCKHPQERRIPLPTMGAKRFKCMDCNEDVLEQS